ncbi:MAG: rod shape-determining protein [Firmicutes bacterium]|nr:rod shape-determining protein [Bacillota bacterium]
MFGKDIGVDLGTANVLVHVRGKGVVLNEPSVVAIESNSKRVVAVGEEARKMLGRTPGNIVAIRPLREGVIADFEITEVMLKHFIAKAVGKGRFARPNVCVCIPAGITSVEQKAVRQATEAAGAKRVYLIEEPKAAAIGAGLDITQPSGNMVVDIGGGTTDVAVLSLGDVVTASSIRVAGDKFDEAIIRYIKRNHNLLIGERTAEEIKIRVVSVFPEGRQEEIDIRGRDMISGLPKTVTIYTREMAEALADSVQSIVATAKTVLERTPPELASDIFDKGVVVTGGGALLHGIDRLLTEELQVPVNIADDPMTCVARGTGAFLENIEKFGRQDGQAMRRTR